MTTKTIANLTLEQLLPGCTTDNQRELLAAMFEHGGPTAAAKALGMSPGTMRRRFGDIRKRVQAFDGLSQPSDNALNDTSTLYDANGEVRLRWEKTRVQREQYLRIMREAAAAFAENLPRTPAVQRSPAASTRPDLLNLYVITDYHMGMLAWAEETRGDDWDLDIAAEVLIQWFAEAIRRAPPAESCVFAQLGDFLHWDGMEAITPASKHILDADTRFQKLVRMAIKCIRTVIRMLLEKYTVVHIKYCDANHDPASAVHSREWMDAHYEEEPRITVDTSPDAYYCHEFGDVSLYFHHGHKRKPANIDDVFVAKFREIFGRTRFSYAHTGHLHSKEVVSTNLMKIEQHETLASADAYASRGGWISDRSAQAITYHRKYGEVGRVRITPEMLRE